LPGPSSPPLAYDRVTASANRIVVALSTLSPSLPAGYGLTYHPGTSGKSPPGRKAAPTDRAASSSLGISLNCASNATSTSDEDRAVAFKAADSNRGDDPIVTALGGSPTSAPTAVCSLARVCGSKSEPLEDANGLSRGTTSKSCNETTHGP